MSNILAKLESLSKAATPAPWQKSIGLSGVIPTKNYDSAFDCGPKDADLIAAMRNSIDALIEVARAVQKCSREGYDLPYPIEKALAELERTDDL